MLELMASTLRAGPLKFDVIPTTSVSPDALIWSQHRVPSTNQLPISMVNSEITVYGQYGVGSRRECAINRPKNDVEV